MRRAFPSRSIDSPTRGWPLELACPDIAGVSSLWSTISACEGYAAYGWLLESALEQLHPRTVEFLRAGERHSLRDYFDALEERTRIARRWLELFERYDLLVTPTVELTAFPIGLPVGLQIVGRRGEDDVVLAAAAAFESLLPWQGGYDRVGTSAVVGVGSGRRAPAPAAGCQAVAFSAYVHAVRVR